MFRNFISIFNIYKYTSPYTDTHTSHALRQQRIRFEHLITDHRGSFLNTHHNDTHKSHTQRQQRIILEHLNTIHRGSFLNTHHIYTLIQINLIL